MGNQPHCDYGEGLAMCLPLTLWHNLLCQPVFVPPRTVGLRLLFSCRVFRGNVEIFRGDSSIFELSHKAPPLS
jgi:hypothetical protein